LEPEEARALIAGIWPHATCREIALTHFTNEITSRRAWNQQARSAAQLGRSFSTFEPDASGWL
jgi:hypothetical protein